MSVIDEIQIGVHDMELKDILEAVRERQKDLAAEGLSSIQVGDTIRFSATTKPTYLRGLQAIVKKVNGKSVIVDIENNPLYGRFAGQRNVRVPASLVEKVSIPGPTSLPRIDTLLPITPEQRSQFEHLANQLSPENLTCDGELSKTQVGIRRANILRQWAALETQVGRKVYETEIWGVG